MLFRGPALPPPKDTLLEAFSHHVAIQGRPEAENVRFGGGGGLVAGSFFEQILGHFWRGPGQQKHRFRVGEVSKMTISPKSEFCHFLVPFWGSFWSQNLPKMAL